VIDCDGTPLAVFDALHLAVEELPRIEPDIEPGIEPGTDQGGAGS
jgi:hypothetical protein